MKHTKTKLTVKHYIQKCQNPSSKSCSPFRKISVSSQANHWHPFFSFPRFNNAFFINSVHTNTKRGTFHASAFTCAQLRSNKVNILHFVYKIYISLIFVEKSKHLGPSWLGQGSCMLLSISNVCIHQ